MTTEAVIAQLREELVLLHQELVRWGLVVWTAGNVSARVPGAPLLLIKPSGILTDDLDPASMVLCDLEGVVVEDNGFKPSSDTASHAVVYRERDDVGGVVHTHSPYACAFAAVGEPIPCVLTGIADEFGGPIPLGPFATIGSEDIGRSVVETLAGHRSRAVLMQNHGVFAIGPDARSAVKAAVLCEDSARAVHLARGLGTPVPIAEHHIDTLHHRYRNVYGQPGG